jgi:hypothetical protein
VIAGDEQGQRESMENAFSGTFPGSLLGPDLDQFAGERQVVG